MVDLRGDAEDDLGLWRGWEEDEDVDGVESAKADSSVELLEVMVEEGG